MTSSIRLLKISPTAELLIVVAVVAACISIALCSPATSLDGRTEQELKHRSPTELPALFDYEHYQRVFGKKYGSELEILSRRVYVWANALQVYLSGIAFKFWRQSYYLALNHLSDLSPQERDRMRNKVMLGKIKQSKDKVAEDAERVTIDDGPNPELAAGKLEAEIETIVAEVNSKGLFQEGKLRKKRETGTTRPRRKPRELSMDMLIQGNGPVPEPAEVLANWDKDPEGDNELYDPLQLEPLTRGLIDQQVELPVWAPRFHIPGEEVFSVSAIFQRGLEMLNSLVVNNRDEEKEEFFDTETEFDEVAFPDEMFIDLRNSGCMFQPRNQGNCGSCYAFAGITMAEWLFCKKKRTLVRFSEQYMVDCGNGRLERMNGCDGGIVYNMPNFIHNFGLELESHYRYVGYEQECPYDNNTNLETTGFIRMELGNFAEIPVKAWPQVLKFTPIQVAIATQEDFYLYGGGVYDGQGCAQEADHAMVVVGHGRENGEEFWLIRNSHGPHWGAGGYFKLAKSAPNRCIHDQSGYVYGTKTGFDYNVEPIFNKENNMAILKKLRDYSFLY